MFQLAHELVVAQERISQLEVENRRMLDAKQEMETRLRLDGVLSQSGNESGVMEHSLHEDMKLSLGEANNNERIRELETEKEQLLERVRTAESKIAQLESELKVETKKKADAKKMLDDIESYGQDDEEKKKDTVDLRLQIEKQNIEIDHLRKLYESAEKKATEADEAKLRTVEELENQKKTNAAMEEQHRVYMEKAKLIIVDQDRRMTATSETGFSHAEFDSMRRTIEQKEKQIRRLEERLTEMCNMHEQEQRLVTTQYYQMTQKVEQADRRNGSMEQNGGPKTFLSQHRQSTAFTARSLRGPAATILTVFICYVLYYFIEYINDPDVFY
ncbi:hypothetical protein WR25_06001 [Diploscapter pachys]|uniref:Hook C-terminal domain-containing protein n=1 Tax=Diploscapter pachys TaxID=2018661 RepID=A0A2A2LQC5_9BILA|nr:hypothetical protein WR25_06001 [Diploscapter pachys]